MGRRAALVALLILHGAWGLAPALLRIENDFENEYAPARAL